jgi:PelA/Pel-15E family pectate lyase
MPHRRDWRLEFWSGIGLRTLALILLAGAVPAFASTVGTSLPAESITRDRISRLPQAERASWINYLQHSERQRRADKDAFYAELKRAGIKTPIEPPHDNSARSVPLNRDSSWYASPEARHIADIILSYQTPAGGWSKNLDMSRNPRLPGESFAPDNLSKFLSPGDFDEPLDRSWNYVGTIDNDATTTQIIFLAKVISSASAENGKSYRTGFERGLGYLFAAQFPNGGWPQVWPLEGGYHDAITYNDDAMIHVAELMRSVADGKGDFSFVAPDMRNRAAASFAHAISCILATQIVSNGILTVWPQQDDPLTLKPVSGRNFEPPAECSSESAEVLVLLMNDLQNPTAAEGHSIRSAGAWFKRTAIYGQSWHRASEGLVPTPGAGPIWSRFYQTDTELPVFGDRDKSIHDQVNELSKERQNGYRWYGSDPQSALARFEKWSQEHPESR